MRKLLGTLTLVVIVIAIIGNSRDWFKVQRSTHGASTEVHLQIDREKIRADTAHARGVAREIRENLGTKVEQKLDRRVDEPAPW